MKTRLSLWFFLLFFLGCSSPSAPEPEKPRILVSLAPYAFLAQQIAGPLLDIEILVPPGTNPHIYEPTPKQVASLGNVALWFCIGEPIEEKIFPLLWEQNGKLEKVDLSEGIPLIEAHHCCHHTSYDRHFWLSPKLALQQARNMSAKLSLKFPEFASQFGANLSKLSTDLKTLDAALTKDLLPFAGSALLVSHPAFAYFCKEFGLVQLSIEIEGKDPRPQDIERIVKEAQALHARAVFTQVQYNNKGALLIARELHLPVYEIDPYALNYPAMLKELVHEYVQAH